MPLVWQRLHNVPLESIMMRKRKQPRAQLDDPLIHIALTRAQRLQLA